MPHIKELVPGSKSDRLSFHSDLESLDPVKMQEVPLRPVRAVSRDSSRDNTLTRDKSKDITLTRDNVRDKSKENTLTRDKSRDNTLTRDKSRNNTLRKHADGSNAWTTVNISDGMAQRQNSQTQQNCFLVLCSYIYSWVCSFNPLNQQIFDSKDPYFKNRVVSKEGKINTHRDTQKKALSMVLKDLFISSIHLSWSWTIFNFFASFVLSWAFFAIIWYLIAVTHGDLVAESERPEGHKVCVDNVEDFTTAFLFSVETQHTIGYGGRATTSECKIAILVMSIQSIIGVFIDACMTGIVFAKFTKPTHRAKTILFSKNALVTMRNGAFYLLCRVGDLRPTHLIESHISGYIMETETTEEGEEIPHHLHAIEFGTDLDGTQDFFQLFWPIVLSHRIDENSPLWDCSAQDLLTKKFEILLTMEGTTPETGNNIQVRTSYLPCEILWGYKFQHSCVHYDEQNGKYEVSFDTLNTIIKDENTPRVSPHSYEEDKRRKAEEASECASVCSRCSSHSIRRDSGAAPLSAIPKAFFGKARTKNKTHKLPGLTD